MTLGVLHVLDAATVPQKFSQLTAGVLCKINQFWPTMMRRPSSLSQKSKNDSASHHNFQTIPEEFIFSQRRMPPRP